MIISRSKLNFRRGSTLSEHQDKKNYATNSTPQRKSMASGASAISITSGITVRPINLELHDNKIENTTAKENSHIDLIKNSPGGLTNLSQSELSKSKISDKDHSLFKMENNFVMDQSSDININKENQNKLESNKSIDDNFFEINLRSEKRETNYDIRKIDPNLYNSNKPALEIELSEPKINMEGLVLKKLELKIKGDGDDKENDINKIQNSPKFKNFKNNFNKLIVKKDGSIDNNNSNESFKSISFKISLIFTFYHVSDVILFNLLLMIFFMTKETNGLDLGLNYTILLVVLAQVLFAIFINLINNCIVNYSNNSNSSNENKLYSVKKVLLSCLFIITISYSAINFIQIENKLINACCFSILFVLRNLTLTSCVTCYNLLLSKISNTEIKELVKVYQQYISYVCRALFGLLTFGFIFYFEKEYKCSYIFDIFWLLSALFPMINFCLINQFKKLISEGDIDNNKR